MLLTDKQMDRILRRDKLDPVSRKNNEVAVRNHLSKFLESVDGINFILDKLPKNQLKRLVTDEIIIRFLELANKMLLLYDLDYGYRIRQYNAVTDSSEVYCFSERDRIMRDALRSHIKNMEELYEIINAKAELAGLIPMLKERGQEPQKHRNVCLDVNSMKSIFQRHIVQRPEVVK